MTQALLAVFPQIPNTIKKNLDEMERESLRLMNESFQLLIRRTSLCVFSLISSGLKETVITPLSQKLEKNITSMNYCTESAFASFFTPRNELKTEQQAEELTQSELHLIQFTLSPFFFLFFSHLQLYQSSQQRNRDDFAQRTRVGALQPA